MKLWVADALREMFSAIQFISCRFGIYLCPLLEIAVP